MNKLTSQDTKEVLVSPKLVLNNKLVIPGVNCVRNKLIYENYFKKWLTSKVGISY